MGLRIVQDDFKINISLLAFYFWILRKIRDYANYYKSNESLEPLVPNEMRLSDRENFNWP